MKSNAKEVHDDVPIFRGGSYISEKSNLPKAL